MEGRALHTSPGMQVMPPQVRMLRSSQAQELRYFCTAILTHPALSLSGTVSAPSPGTSAPSPAARWLRPQSRCRCSAPPRPCLLPLQQQQQHHHHQQLTGPEVNKCASWWRHVDATNRKSVSRWHACVSLCCSCRCREVFLNMLAPIARPENGISSLWCVVVPLDGDKVCVFKCRSCTRTPVGVLTL